jgi:hypothetical protein
VFHRDSLAALKGIQGYAPANSGYTETALTALQTGLDTRTVAATLAEAEAKTKRDDEVSAGWAFHDAVVGMRDSVGAQFGKNSNEFQAVGRKKTSEYKKPVRQPKKSSS